MKNLIILVACCVLASQCQSKQQGVASTTHYEKTTVMSNNLKAKIISARNQPLANAVASITEGPADFPEIAALSDSTGYLELPTGGKTGIYTVNVYVNNKSHLFKITMPQTLAIETLKIEE